MNNVELVQKFIKAARIIVFILMLLCLAMTLFSLSALVMWIVCGNMYIWSLNDVVVFILSMFHGGSYYGSLALAATSVIAYAVRTILLYYGLRCCNGAIREGTPFNKQTYREAFWLGVKIMVLPVLAMLLNVGIFSYMSLTYGGAYVGGILSLAIGILMMALSVVLYIATRKTNNSEADACDAQAELTEQDAVSVDE